VAGILRPALLTRVPAPLLLVGSVISVQIGGALAKHVIDDVGPAGGATLRLVFAGLLLGAVYRPRIVRKELALVAAYGVTLGAMNLLFYEALARTPLGVVVTVEFLGPLAVAVAGSRRPRDGAVVVLAGAGIVLLARGGGAVNAWGLILSALAGACWGGYILISAAVGRRHEGAAPLAAAMMIAMLVVLPFGARFAIHADARSLWLGALVALLSSVVPYSLELLALRRLPARVFGVLMSGEPAVAALAGLVILGETLGGRQWIGVGCVIVACAAVTATSGGAARKPEPVP
jgi:threonine/homoserine efflux transporter RhtA